MTDGEAKSVKEQVRVPIEGLRWTCPDEFLKFETIPGLDKKKGKGNVPSLGMKNFKNASTKDMVSATPIGSPRAQQMAAKLATLNAILEKKRLEKEREAAEARGEVCACCIYVWMYA